MIGSSQWPNMTCAHRVPNIKNKILACVSCELGRLIKHSVYVCQWNNVMVNVQEKESSIHQFKNTDCLWAWSRPRSPNVETLKPPCFQVKLVQMSSGWIGLCKALEEKKQPDRKTDTNADLQTDRLQQRTTLQRTTSLSWKSSDTAALNHPLAWMFCPGGNIGFAERLTHHS